MPQERNQIGQGPGKPGAELEIFHNQHCDQSRPDLRFHGIGAGTEECLDFQILLDCLEQLDYMLPINSLPLKSQFTTASIT